MQRDKKVVPQMRRRELLVRLLLILGICLGSIIVGTVVVWLSGGDIQLFSRATAPGTQGDSAAEPGMTATPPTPAIPAATNTAQPATPTAPSATTTIIEPPTPTAQPATPTVAPPSSPPAVAQTATATPEASAPPAATATPAPPSPTPTVSAPPTPASPTAPVGAIFMEDSFDTPASGWPVQDATTWSAQYADGRYRLTLNGRSSAGVSVPVPATDYRLSVDVILGEQGDAGVIMLFREPATFYQIAVRRDGTYALQRLEGDQVTNIEDWTASAALRQGAGVANRLRIERTGPSIQFFANDQLLTEFTPPAEPLTNRYGFTITSPTEQGEAQFDNLLGERISSP